MKKAFIIWVILGTMNLTYASNIVHYDKRIEKGSNIVHYDKRIEKGSNIKVNKPNDNKLFIKPNQPKK